MNEPGTVKIDPQFGGQMPQWTLLPLVIVILHLFLVFLTLVIELCKSQMGVRYQPQGVFQIPTDQ